MRKYGESKTTRIKMATVRHVTSGSGLRKFQADGFLFDKVYKLLITVSKLKSLHSQNRINAGNPSERPEPIEIPGKKKVNTQQARSLAVSLCTARFNNH